mmetsp:Transcript_65528/g.188890  ORF Transcript_65528/g.188890 Transcript_65528/m.188890 type:complete len:276 (+) Transcript_65528:376-1203(+)
MLSRMGNSQKSLTFTFIIRSKSNSKRFKANTRVCGSALMKVRFWASTLQPASSLKYALSPSNVSPSTIEASASSTLLLPLIGNDKTRKSSWRMDGANPLAFGAISVQSVPPNTWRNKLTSRDDSALSPAPWRSTSPAPSFADAGVMSCNASLQVPAPSFSKASCGVRPSGAAAMSALFASPADWLSVAVSRSSPASALAVAPAAFSVGAARLRSRWESASALSTRSMSKLKNSSASICWCTLTGRPSQSLNDAQKSVGVKYCRCELCNEENKICN